MNQLREAVKDCELKDDSDLSLLRFLIGKKTSNNVNIIDLIDLKAEESKSKIKTLLLILFFKLFSARDFDLSKSEKMIRNVSIIFIVINSV